MEKILVINCNTLAYRKGKQNNLLKFFEFFFQFYSRSKIGLEINYLFIYLNIHHE